MTKRLCLLFVLVSLVAATASAQDAADVLRNAASAMGAGTVTSIRITGTGWSAPVGQGYTSNEDWPRVEVASYTRVFDYDNRSGRSYTTSCTTSGTTRLERIHNATASVAACASGSITSVSRLKYQAMNVTYRPNRVIDSAGTRRSADRAASAVASR